jgi:hypothetical protein
MLKLYATTAEASTNIVFPFLVNPKEKEAIGSVETSISFTLQILRYLATAAVSNPKLQRYSLLDLPAPVVAKVLIPFLVETFY